MAPAVIAAWAAVASVAVSAGSAIYQNQNRPDMGGEVPQAQISDKTSEIEAGTVDEALIGDEDSLKRKKQSAKAKFKSDLLAGTTADTSTGVTVGNGGGVQI
jgi:hypothetical protein